MKKFLGAIVSGLAGVLSLVFLAMPAFKAKGAGSESGWDLLTDKAIGESDMTAVTWYRIFAWILVVLAIVLIIVAVLQLLSALNVIKLPAIVNTIAKYALIALAVVSVLALVANFGIRSESIDNFKEYFGKAAAKEYGKNLSVGASLWIVSIVNIVAAVCSKVFVKAED
ncbi:MAG: hypothetical protein IJ371_03675 [Clostridia bacterium]|nr:hypothetical protein [Clostridia bacterium]